MTQEEISVFKQSILEAIESYVNIKLSDLPTMKSDIGIILGEGTKEGNKVKIRDAEYDNILSVGNIVFPTNSIVYTLSPNGQYNQLFILGQLSDTPANIVGGTINIGNGTFTVDSDGNVNITEGEINLANNFIVDDNGNVQIKSGSINLANKFIVDQNGKVSILNGSINIGGNFEVNENGTVTIKNGSINLGTDNFIVDNLGNVTIKNGSISLGNGNFTVDNNGAVTIKNGSINLGSGNFIVNNDGSVTIKNGSIDLGNGVFTVDSNGKVNASNLNITGGGISLNNGLFTLTENGDITVQSSSSQISQQFMIQISPTMGFVVTDGYGHMYTIDANGFSGAYYNGVDEDGFPDSFVIRGICFDSTGWELYSYPIDLLKVYGKGYDRSTIYTHISCSNIGTTQTYSNGIVFDDPIIFPQSSTFSVSPLNEDSGIMTTSDKNAKDNIESLNIEDSAKFILSQNPVKYTLKNGESNRLHHGFIAQEVKETMNEDWGIYIDQNYKKDKIEDDKTPTKGLRYDEFIADIVATCQYQQKEIEELKQELKELKEKVEVNNNVNDNTDSE